VCNVQAGKTICLEERVFKVKDEETVRVYNLVIM
jgi:hypothetical protein